MGHDVPLPSTEPLSNPVWRPDWMSTSVICPLIDLTGGSIPWLYRRTTIFESLSREHVMPVQRRPSNAASSTGMAGE
jgi:hypothetical protein